MKESLATEHSGELFADALEELLNGGGVADEGGAHLQSARRDVADGGLDVVGDPFNEVRRVLVLDSQHLVVDFSHGHASTEDGGYGQVTSVARIASSHHVLSVKHLLSKFSNRLSTVSSNVLGGQGSESRHEEVETRERHHVDGKLSQISIQLTWETETSGDSGHCHRD